ncbi:MAG: hypothetical protein K8R02_05995 [Anaerohalosphaeraceae bacterium]|nr:hypothetical protein [Anaerohalosphaeraceae bacterium]
MKILPSRKATGALFAFSGLDGTVDYESQLVGSVMEEDYGFGLSISAPFNMTLWCDTRYSHPFEVSERMILSDAVCYTAKTPDNSEHVIQLVMVDDRTILGRTTSHFPVLCCGEPAVPTKNGKNTVVIESPFGSAVLLTKDMDGDILFAFSAGTNTDKAQVNARQALGLDLSKILKQKIAFFDKLPEPETNDPLIAETFYKSMSVLKSTVYSPNSQTPMRWTTPDRMPHKKMWIWDSAFHALGLQYIEAELAQEAIEAVFTYQSEDGFIPHMMAPGYGSEFTQPPILGWAGFEIFENTGDKDFLNRVINPLEKFIRWVLKHRSKRGGDSLGWLIREGHSFPDCKAGETGMDNSPRFDNVHDVESVDIISFVIQEIEILTKMSEVLGRTVPADMLEKQQTLINTLQTTLWDDKDGFFYDRKHGGDFIPVKTVSAFTPLFAGVATNEQAEQMVRHLKNPDHFWTHLPVPSTAISEPAYTKDYWRGPTWVNYSYIVMRGLRRYGYTDIAEEIRNRTINEIARWYKETGVLWELYDTEGAVSPEYLLTRSKSALIRPRHLLMPAVRDFGWTAALFIHTVLE